MPWRWPSSDKTAGGLESLRVRFLGSVVGPVGRPHPISIPKLATVIFLAFCIGESQGQARFSAAAVDTYLQSYVRTNNFAGTVLVEKKGTSTLPESLWSRRPRT